MTLHDVQDTGAGSNSTACTADIEGKLPAEQTNQLARVQQPDPVSPPQSVKEAVEPEALPPTLECWNHPRVNLYRTLACLWCFVILGANDAAYGVSILENYTDFYFLNLLSSYLTDNRIINITH
jgi:hypothetical protein